MADLIPLFRSFIRVVEAGSFTAVALEQNTSQPTISRQIAALEEHLGCLLLQRTTRALTLTDDGRAFYAQAQLALDALAEAETSVGRRKGKPTGTLRLACAAVLGRLHILPRLPRFLERYPDVAVDLVMSDDFTDLVEQRIDLSIRVGALTDPGLVARRIGTTRRVLVATPAYLERHGEPQTPEGLRQHSCIIYTRLATGMNWPFTGRDGPISVPIQGRIRVSSTEGVRAAILSGLGIGMVPIWHFVDGEIASGRLKLLLPGYEPGPHPIHAVYPTRRFVAPKLRAMLDYLATEFELDPLLSAYAEGR